MLLTNSIRFLIPLLLLFPQGSVVASTTTLRTTEIAQTSTASGELEIVKKDLAESTRKLEKLQNNFDALKDDQKKKLEDQQKYNSDLMNTVFFSLLGSVLTVSSAILGFQFFVQILDRNRERQELIEEAKNHLQYYMDKKLHMLEVRIGWLEYQIATLTADQSERRGIMEDLFVIQDRVSAIQALRRLSNKYQQEQALKRINSEMAAIKFLLEKPRDIEELAPVEEDQEIETNYFREKSKKSSLNFFNRLIEEDDFQSLNLEKSEIRAIRDLLRNR